MEKWVWLWCPSNIRHLRLLTWFSIVHLICNRQGRNPVLHRKASHWRSQKKTSHLFSQGKHVSVRSHGWRRDEGCSTRQFDRAAAAARAPAEPPVGELSCNVPRNSGHHPCASTARTPTCSHSSPLSRALRRNGAWPGSVFGPCTVTAPGYLPAATVGSGLCAAECKHARGNEHQW